MLACVGLIGCKRKGSAIVSCTHIEKLETGLGLLNIPDVLVGNVIEIVPSTKKGSHKASIKLDSGDISVTAGNAVTDISHNSGLTITFSANIPGTATAALNSTLSDSMQLQLANSKRHQIDNPEPVLNRPDNLRLINGIFQNSLTGHRYLLVFGGNSADSVNFALKGGTTNRLTTTIPSVGSFELDVNYQCQGDLTTKAAAITASAANAAGNGKDLPTFFKVVEIIKNADGSISVTTFDGDIADYDLSSAVM